MIFQIGAVVAGLILSLIAISIVLAIHEATHGAVLLIVAIVAGVSGYHGVLRGLRAIPEGSFLKDGVIGSYDPGQTVESPQRLGWQSPLLLAFAATVILPMGVGSVASIIGGVDLAEEEDATIASEAPPPDHTYVRVGEVRDVSYAQVRRFEKRIVIPPERQEASVRATLESAAMELHRQTRGDAVVVFAYSNADESQGVFTIGKATYAPNGRWQDAGTRAPKRLVIELADRLPVQRTRSVASGSRATLVDRTGHVYVSILPDSWGDEDITAKVPTGTVVTVIRRESFQLGAGNELVRYLIEGAHQGTEIYGWVHSHNIQ